MKRVFLSAEWRNLLMANYAIDPTVLKPYVPAYTELDFFNGTCYVSLVGFLFKDTRVQGLSFPFHRTFEEVNLRFYVRHKTVEGWKRGVVFIKEIVPKRMISFVANTIYKEKYCTQPMRHEWRYTEEGLEVGYFWKTNQQWDHLKVVANKQSESIKEGSEEEFITEHYWGYTQINPQLTGAYEVVHPKWNIHHVKKYDIQCNIKALYGDAFKAALSAPPSSVFLAEGSPIQVLKGAKVLITELQQVKI